MITVKLKKQLVKTKQSDPIHSIVLVIRIGKSIIGPESIEEGHSLQKGCGNDINLDQCQSSVSNFRS